MVFLQEYPLYDFVLTADERLVVINRKTKRVMKGYPNEKGYIRFRLVTAGTSGTRKNVRRAKLLLTLFGETARPSPSHTCDHINRIRDDDRLSNLRWLSVSEQNTNRACFGKGYYFCKDRRRKPWCVRVFKRHYGYYATEEEAKARVVQVRRERLRENEL
jgi:hypothetical protein